MYLLAHLLNLVPGTHIKGTAVLNLGILEDLVNLFYLPGTRIRIIYIPLRVVKY